MGNKGIRAQIVEKEIKQDGINIVYPQVTGLPDMEAQEKVNRAIEERVLALMARQRVWPDEAGLKISEMTGTYKIGVNKSGILSVRIENFIFPEMAAHGMTMADSVTVDLETGKVYKLSDLFQRGTGWIMALNEIIARQFKEKDIPMINEFRGITPNQHFYLTQNKLVIYFQIYEYTPYYVGIPEFEISCWKIINYIDPNKEWGHIF